MKKFNFKKIRTSSEFYVFLIIILLSVVIQLRSGLFFTNNNIVDIARSMIVPSIYALCAFLAFISTGPDVSFPLIAALSSYLAIMVTYKTGYDGPWIFVFLVGMLFGGIMGALNGFIIVKYKFPSLIVTLGTSSIFSGILLGAFEAERMELPEIWKGFAAYCKKCKNRTRFHTSSDVFDSGGSLSDRIPGIEFYNGGTRCFCHRW